MNWLLEWEEVRYTYPGGQHQALNGLTMRIPAGKKCVLLGHNGCGKSTLFLHANGIYRPDSGQVKWCGNPVRYDRESTRQLRQSVGLVFQDPEQQIVASTVSEDISYGLCNAHLPEAVIRERVDQVMARFNLTQLADRPVHQLSMGQKKRVALAGVMALTPKLLLLDEPTASLDRLHSGELFTELQAIHLSGTTILMATHDLDIAYAWADWIFVMDQGKLMLEGTPDKVFGQRSLVESLNLGVPLVFDIWEALPSSIRNDPSHFHNRPRTAAELKERLRFFSQM